jgi:hypothetical protein
MARARKLHPASRPQQEPSTDRRDRQCSLWGMREGIAVARRCQDTVAAYSSTGDADDGSDPCPRLAQALARSDTRSVA